MTSNGRPLYTFAGDRPGDAKGDGFTDVFAGRHSVWHTVAASGHTPPASHSTSGQSGGGYTGGGY